MLACEYRYDHAPYLREYSLFGLQSRDAGGAYGHELYFVVGGAVKAVVSGYGPGNVEARGRERLIGRYVGAVCGYRVHRGYDDAGRKIIIRSKRFHRVVTGEVFARPFADGDDARVDGVGSGRRRDVGAGRFRADSQLAFHIRYGIAVCPVVAAVFDLRDRRRYRARPVAFAV